MKEKLMLWFIPKVEKDLTDFKIVEVLKKYMMYTNGINSMISSPGYLSKISSSNTVKKFCDEFSKIVPNEKTIYIGYLKGYRNGTILVSNPTSVSVIDEHYKYLMKTGKFKRLYINFADKSDHRKMIFFFESDVNFDENFMLELGTLSYFLDVIKVNAVLIGSSNQSFKTYYGGTAKKADKGEADLLMFSYDKLNFSNNLFNVEGTTIFEGSYGAGLENPNEYMKEILKGFLENALI